MFLNLISLFLLIIIVTSFGRRLFSIFRIKFNDPLEYLVFSIGLGFGILSLFVLTIGLFGLLYKSAIYLILLFILLFSISDIKKVFLDISQSWKNNSGILTKRTNLLLFIILILLIILNIIGASGPPSAMDPLVYHLTIPKIYIEKHKIEYFSYTWLSNFPFNMEMLYTLGMIIIDDIFPAQIHFVFGLFISIAIFLFCKMNQKEEICLFSIVLFYAMPLTTFVSTSAFSDFGLIFYLFVSFISFYKWRIDLKKQWLILLGIFSGFACGCKFTGLFVSAILVLFIAFESIRQKKSIISNIFIFSIFAIIFGGVWYLKNLLWTGNPVYPFLYNLFGGRDWNAYSNNSIMNFYGESGAGKNIFKFVLALWNITQNGEKFDIGYALGPIFLSFLPISILFWKRLNFCKILVLFSFIYFILWFTTVQITRLLFPILPLLSIIAAFVILELINIGGIIKKTTIIIFSLFIIFSLTVSIVFNSQFIPVVFKKLSRDEFLSKKVNLYDDFKYMNKNLPKNSKILIFGSGQYYLDRNWIPASPFHQGLINYMEYNNEEEFLTRLKELGVTHIFKLGRTTLEEINSARLYEKHMFKLQLDLEQNKFLEIVYHNKTKYYMHRTLSMYEYIVDVYLYEIDYSKI